MASNNPIKHNNYQGGSYQIGSTSRVIPSSSNPGGQSSTSPAWGGGNAVSQIQSNPNKTQPMSGEDKKNEKSENVGHSNSIPSSTGNRGNSVQANHARGNVNSWPNQHQHQHQQNHHPAMYHQHYGHQSFHAPNFSSAQPMNPYQHHQQQQHQLYMQQQAVQQQRLYMMQQHQQQQQQQHQHHYQQQQSTQQTTESTPVANTPTTIYRTNYYAMHGNASTAATVPAMSWTPSNPSTTTNSTNNSTGSSINAQGTSNTNDLTQSNTTSNSKQVGMLPRTYANQTVSYNHHQSNPYGGNPTSRVNGGTSNANSRASGVNIKPKKKLVITDKDGKPLDLSGISTTPTTAAISNSSSPPSITLPPTESTTNMSNASNSNANKDTSASAPTSTNPNNQKREDAGAKLRAAAERNLKENLNAREERERLEKERLEKERMEKERVEKEKLEKERLEKEMQERLEKERLEKERLKQERLEKERLEKEKLEKEKLEKERLEKERVEKELERESSRNKSPVPASRLGLRPGGFRPGGGSGASGLRPGGPSLRPGGGRAGMTMAMQAPGGDGSSSLAVNGVKRTYSKAEILELRDLPLCCVRPTDLPDMTITSNYRGQSGSNHRQGGGQSRSQWTRGSTPVNSGGPPRNAGNSGHHHHHRQGGQDKSWSRGEAPPPQRPPRGGRGGRGGRGNNRQSYHDEYTGPVAPLVKSENRWMPQKNNSVMVAVEKKVNGILNKMTKEKFGKLSNQMCDIPILSYEMLTMMIHKVYEKAIDEPAFGDMYADLCCRLADNVSPESIINIIQSNEPKPDTSGMEQKELDRWKKYEDGADTWRWTNDVATDDNEVVGPFETVEECRDCAVNDSGQPSPREEKKLTLVECRIIDDIFCKISVDKIENKYYTVYFPVADAKKCNQQLSNQFPTQDVCKNDAIKQNSFKRTLLNKCEDEFNKQDIYIDWKKEMKEYESGKDKLSEKERAETEEELDFRRMKIKKQMLGNIKFIGELYKKSMIRENIMHFCIQSLLKIDKNDEEMDEEDHEALCNLFTTIGKHLDSPKNEQELTRYFRKMKKLSEDDKNLSFRSRFMYKDLIDLRKNRWKVRREELKAKTINEIRKEAAREEKEKEKQSNYNRNYNNRGGHEYRGDSRRGGSSSSSRRDPVHTRERSTPVVDSSGFTRVSHGKGGSHGVQSTSSRKLGGASKSSLPSSKSRKSNNTQSFAAPKRVQPPAAPAPTASINDATKYPPLTKDKFELRTKNICDEFIQDPNNTTELFLSFDELTGTPDSGKQFVQICVDRIVDMKSNDIEVMVSMLQVLYKSSKLYPPDIKFGLGETIEFLDSTIYDCPKIFSYVGDILAKFLQLEALSLTWICETCQKMFAMKDKLIEETIKCVKEQSGETETSSLFLKEEHLLENLLGSQDWKRIKEQLIM